MRFTHSSIRAWHAGFSAALVLLLCGCTGAPEVPPPSPPPTSAAPLFSSDEEALAAATEAYRAYLAMVDVILSDGGRDPERIRQVASGQAAEDFIVDAKEFTERGLRSKGAIGFTIKGIQERHGSDGLSVYACDDLRSVALIGPDGTAVVRAADARGASFVVGLVRVELRLLVSSRFHWEGPTLCAHL